MGLVRERVSLNKVNQAVKGRRAQLQSTTAGKFYKKDKKRKNSVELTTNQVSYMFDVTPMTVYNWRQGRDLPYYHLGGGQKPPVRYDEGLILQWAESHGIVIYHDDYIEH